MSMSFGRLRLSIWIVSLLIVGCAAKHAEGPPAASPAARPAQGPSVADAPRAPSGLYTAEEALRDALSGPWEYVGTGPWPGIRRMQACAFRNQRVLVVNVYCTITEQQAFRIDVYSPTRGRVRIYAEAKGPVSAHSRREYFTFMAESEPPPNPEMRLQPLSLNMSFPELRAYDEQRYEAFLPACYAGTELDKQKSGCLDTLAPRKREWNEQNRAFLEQASNDWYRVVREMRALSMRYGKEPA